MQTIKIKYITSTEHESLIRQYQRQYNCVVRYGFNRMQDNNSITQKDLRASLGHMSNRGLIGSWLEQSAVYDIKALYAKNLNDKVIFGGKKLFYNRLKGLITNQEYKTKRLLPICSVGEALQKGNRLFNILNDLNIVFKPCKGTAITLETTLRSNYRKLLKQLYDLQQQKECPITYKLTDTHIYITFDESYLKLLTERVKVENRICSIDLNPNYIGYTITDWKTENTFKVLDSGVYDLKYLNELDKSLKGLPSTDSKRVYLNDKRKHELMHIAKDIISKCIQLHVDIFSCESLNISSSDKGKGKTFNKLCNNVWVRNAFIDNLKKRCNIHSIKFVEVKANYSSFIGNFVFRSIGIPDMCLAAFEIGRRAYEWNEQYLLKRKDKKKNIIFLDTERFKTLIIKSMEEFNIQGNYSDLKGLYEYLKNTKQRYRVSLDTNIKFYRFMSCHSKINYVCNIHNLQHNTIYNK